MTLRLRILALVASLNLVFVAAVLALQWRTLREAVAEEVVAANRVAAQLLNRVVWTHAAQGPQALLAYLQGLGRVRSNDIVLVGADGRELYRSPPSAYKAGRDAPAWFVTLIAPPAAEQRYPIGSAALTIRADASRAALDAWDNVVALAGAGAAMLLLLNAGVYLAVGRAVRPLGQIVEGLNALEAGRFDARLPPLPGREAAAIGGAFNRMVGVLHEHIETEKRAVRAERALHDSRELARWIDHQVEAERRLIARELHDELGQSVTAMRSLALSIAQQLQGREPTAEQAAQVIAAEASRLYDAMHGLIPRLVPLVLDRFGLPDALGDLVERTRRLQPGMAIELTVALGDGARLSADAALALYRAAQEGLANAARHGEARHVVLRLQAGVDGNDGTDGTDGTDGSDGDGGVQGALLTVTDDGRGLPPQGIARPGHYGLRWVAERVQALGGTVEVGPAPGGRGVRLAVALPPGAGEPAPAPGAVPAAAPPALPSLAP